VCHIRSLARQECASRSEAGSYLRLIDFVYHSTLGLRVIKIREGARQECASRDSSSSPSAQSPPKPELCVPYSLDSGTGTCRRSRGRRGRPPPAAPPDGTTQNGLRSFTSVIRNQRQGQNLVLTVLYVNLALTALESGLDCLTCGPESSLDCLICGTGTCRRSRGRRGRPPRAAPPA